MSLFGSTQTKPLFGSLGTNNNQQQQPGSGGLFGSQGQSQQSGGLFGNQQQQNNNPFGGQQSQPQQQNAGLFGQSQPQQQGGGLFGQSTQPQQTSGLFGSSLQQQQPQQQQQQQSQPSNSLFGQPSLNTSFGNSQQQQQAQQQQAQQQQSRSIWQPGSGVAPRQKTVPEQMQTLLQKWSPQSPTCLFQHYFYNEVRPGTAAFYAAPPDEDEVKWEEALSKKPDEDAIPVLCKGFAMLGNRLKTQVQGVSALQNRLHEINNCLTAILEAHDMDITVKANDAKRRHVALSQRCLQLATKIQVLRNRGYALDGAEEGLRKKLLELERAAFDPRLNGRQEEIWARMVGLRDRASLLQEELDKASTASSDKDAEALDPDILKQVKKVLGDYDSQITHLSRELEAVRKDYTEWEKGGGT